MNHSLEAFSRGASVPKIFSLLVIFFWGGGGGGCPSTISRTTPPVLPNISSYTKFEGNWPKNAQDRERK